MNANLGLGPLMIVYFIGRYIVYLMISLLITRRLTVNLQCPTTFQASYILTIDFYILSLCTFYQQHQNQPWPLS